MPRRYPAEVRHQVIELARSGTKVAQLVAAFGMSDATIYNWLKQERVDAAVTDRFARNLRRIRLARDTGQEELRELYSGTHGYLARLERGGQEPELLTVVRLAGCPFTDVDEFVAEDDGLRPCDIEPRFERRRLAREEIAGMIAAKIEDACAAGGLSRGELLSARIGSSPRRSRPKRSETLSTYAKKAWLLLVALCATFALAPSAAGAATTTPELGPVKHISVDGMSMGYRTGGSGTPLIMVMGRSATMAEWDPQLIAQLIGDHEVIVFDNRGVATTNNPSSRPLTIAQMAEDTLGLANALDIERFDLMGWSMGGYISQQVAIDEPGRIEKLVLCATDTGGPHYVPPSPRVTKILTNPEGVTTAQLLSLSFPLTRAGMSGAVNYMFRVATQPDLEPESFTISQATMEAQTVAINAWKSTSGGSWEGLPTITAPTLVAWGNLDRGVRPINDRRLARRIPNSSSQVFRGAGHAFLFQDASQVGGAVDGFLG